MRGVGGLRVLFGVGIGFCVGGARLPFGALPFGAALLCASGKDAAWVYIGLCLSLFRADNPIAWLIAYTLCFAFRVGASLLRGRRGALTLGEAGEKIFGEGLVLRAFEAAITVLGVYLYRLLAGGFLYYDLYALFVSIAVSLLACVLWSGLPYALSERESLGTWKKIGAAALAAASVWGLNGITVVGIYMSVAVCMLFSLLATRRGGVIFGSFVALASGLCVSVSFAPLFVFATVCFAFFGMLSPLVGCVLGMAAALTWGRYIGGLSATFVLLSSLGAANIIFYVMDKLFFATVETKRESGETAEKNSGGTFFQAQLDALKSSVTLAGESLSSLSKTLENSDGGVSYNSSDILSLARRYKNGLSAEIGVMCEPTETAHLDSGFFAMSACFGAMSEYILSAARQNSNDFLLDVHLGERIAECLDKDVLKDITHICVFGKENVSVLVSSKSERALKRHSRSIGEAITRACGFAVRVGETAHASDEYLLLFKQREVLNISICGKRRNALGESEYCGDSFGIVDTEKSLHRRGAFICDGMGSGRKAAASSTLCANILEDMLGVGMLCASEESICSLINGVLRENNVGSENECSCTLDLGVFDALECRATFYKSGAAPTYILRDGSLFKLRARTVPLGIMNGADVGKLNLELLPGDVVIMVSDGVSEGREDCPELLEYLRPRILTHSAEQLADAVIEYADIRGCEDDATVIVAKVGEMNI